MAAYDHPSDVSDLKPYTLVLESAWPLEVGERAHITSRLPLELFAFRPETFAIDDATMWCIHVFNIGHRSQLRWSRVTGDAPMVMAHRLAEWLREGRCDTIQTSMDFEMVVSRQGNGPAVFRCELAGKAALSMTTSQARQR